MALISSIDVIGFDCERERVGLLSPCSTRLFSFVVTIGRTACHSPNLRATPRQTASRVKSSGLQTFPRMNLYKRPFAKRASRGGARLC